MGDPLNALNRHLAGVETVFLLPDPANAHVSSSLVRQVSALGGDVSPYVPEPVTRRWRNSLKTLKSKPGSVNSRASRYFHSSRPRTASAAWR